MAGQPVVIGRIGKPFGVGGQLYVFADADLDDPLPDGVVCTTGDGASLTVRSTTVHGGRLVVAFEGVGTRDAAEALRGKILTRPRDEIVLGEGTVWVEDLIGRQVTDDRGDLVGVVEAITDGHAHDYLVLARPDGGQVQVPLVEELVDWSGDPVVITPIPGLLDPDEVE